MDAAKEIRFDLRSATIVVNRNAEISPMVDTFDTIKSVPLWRGSYFLGQWLRVAGSLNDNGMEVCHGDRK